MKNVRLNNKYERWIVFPDTQIPYEDKRTLKALWEYIADVQASDDPIVGWLQMGDLMDFNELSRWIVGYEASVEGSVGRSFDAGNAFLDKVQEVMSISDKDYEMVVLQGNHDYRTVDFSLRDPRLKEILDYQTNLKFAERGIQYIKCWENHDMFRKGKAFFTHGNFLNKFHAHKMVDTYGVCIYYGHTHDIMEFPKSTWGKDKTIVGKSLGCLCIYNMPYMQTKPSNWQQAFSEFLFFPDGFFQETTTKIFKHRFVGRNGKVYQG
jgi:hypothetical protein